MEAFTIPSPSAFLRSPVLTSTSHPASPKATSKRQPTNSRTHKPPTIGADGVTKPKQSKSRNGCVTCKAKRLKCDETKPSCQQCHKRNVTCGGYKKDFKWRSFEEATFTSKPAPQRTTRAAITIKTEKQPPLSPATSDASGSSFGIGISFVQNPQHVPSAQASPLPPASGLPPHSYANPDNSFALKPPSYIMNDGQHAMAPRSYPDNFQPTSASSNVNTMYDDGSGMHSSMTRESSFSSGQSPRLIDLLLPGTDLNAPPLDYMNYRPQQSEVPYQPGGYPPMQPEILNNEEDDVEEIVRQPDPAEAWVMRLPSPSPSNSSSSSSDGSHFGTLNSVYSQPKLHAGSPEMLMLGFDRQTCGILSVKDGPTENPWRTLVWPLARDSPALYHAISSMTAFHSTKLKPEMKVEGMEHMRRSIRHLASGIENMRTDTALATTLVLAFSESWDVHVKTGIEHLRGAKILVNQALTKHKQNSLMGDDLVRLKFLCNTWVYMDVIARLTSVDDDETTDFDSALWSGGSFMSNTEVDPLMGCASTLFPLIGHVSNLVRKVRKSSTNSFSIISQANDLKGLIEDWQPPSFFEPPEDPTSEIQHNLQTAEAYRWATLLYLHQAVPEIPSQTAAQLAKKVLVYLATVPLSSRAIIVQIYPLIAAGCEAVDQEDRAWVEDRWATMSRRMLIGNIDRCLEVVKEVWHRRDHHEADKTRRNSRRSATRMPSGYSSSASSMKRAFSAEEQGSVEFFDWADSFGGIKRRATQGDLGMPTAMTINPSRKSSTDIVEDIEYEKTVRGRMHWVGVMKDWEWEILLG